jgi:hypothetical protein
MRGIHEPSVFNYTSQSWPWPSTNNLACAYTTLACKLNIFNVVDKVVIMYIAWATAKFTCVFFSSESSSLVCALFVDIIYLMQLDKS